MPNHRHYCIRDTELRKGKTTQESPLSAVIHCTWPWMTWRKDAWCMASYEWMWCKEYLGHICDHSALVRSSELTKTNIMGSQSWQIWSSHWAENADNGLVVLKLRFMKSLILILSQATLPRIHRVGYESRVLGILFYSNLAWRQSWSLALFTSKHPVCELRLKRSRGLSSVTHHMQIIVTDSQSTFRKIPAHILV